MQWSSNKPVEFTEKFKLGYYNGSFEMLHELRLFLENANVGDTNTIMSYMQSVRKRKLDDNGLDENGTK